MKYLVLMFKTVLDRSCYWTREQQSSSRSVDRRDLSLPRALWPCLLAICVGVSATSAAKRWLAVAEAGPTQSPTIAQSMAALPSVSYRDVASASGLTSRHVSGSEEGREYILESTGSGVGLFDYNNDGFLDIFLVTATTLRGFPKGQEPINHLFQNNRDGTFKDVTAEAKLERSGWGQGVCVGDFDNDGNDDLFVTYYGQNSLYHNRGNGTFDDITSRAGLTQEALRWHTGCSFLDFDRDGHLDLFVVEYVNLDLAKTMAKSNGNCIWKGIPVFCGPQGLPMASNSLYRNNRDGTFTDVTAKAGIGRPAQGYGLGSLVSDFDNDGWPDIYVACDSSANLYYHNNGNGSFTETALMAGTAFNRDGKEQGGMGIGAGDYNGDGFLDIIKTNFDGDTPTLYRNLGDGTFFDVTLAAGLGQFIHYVGWGTGFIDVDNDGWNDIYMVNGHVYPEVDKNKLNRSYRQNRQLYYNLRNGAFADLSQVSGPGIADRRSGRGAAVGDIDNDGSQEIAINNMNDTPSLLKNFEDKGNWVLLKLIGKESNRDGIGARVRLFTGNQKQIDEVRSGGSYLSHNDFRLHFGVGQFKTVDRIEVSWPSGRNEHFLNIPANHLIKLEEGSGVNAEKRPLQSHGNQSNSAEPPGKTPQN